MRARTTVLTLVLVFAAALACDDDATYSVTSGAPRYVQLETSMGTITIELLSSRAPVTVDNFMHYANDGFYDGLVMHRVIQDFVVQGGGFDSTLTLRTPTYPPIINEASNGVSNRRGTIAMARTADPNSATSQFFINLKDNPFLDYKNDTPQGAGYCVFARVVYGMDVVDRMAVVPTGSQNGLNDVPTIPIVVFRVVSANWL